MHYKNNKITARTSILAGTMILSGLLFSAMDQAPANAQTAHGAKTANKLMCNQIKSMIRRDRIVFLRDAESGKIQRYVGNSAHCKLANSVIFTSVRSKDKNRCTVTMCISDDVFHDRSRGHHHHHGRGRGRW